jgi:hypothetical protein
MKPDTNHHKMPANEEQRESCSKNELDEEALTSVHGGADIIRPEVMQEGARIAQEVATHQGESVGAHVFKSVGYAAASLATYTAGESIFKKKKNS